jgi:D-glycero-D-manno-heptose 1,7-bisphosphate phosphatase
VEAIARLNHASYRVVVATNQSGIGRGLFDMGMLNTIHEKMHKALCARRGARVDAISSARTPPIPSASAASPRPGMLIGDRQALQHGVDGSAVHRRLFA